MTEYRYMGKQNSSIILKYLLVWLATETTLALLCNDCSLPYVRSTAQVSRSVHSLSRQAYLLVFRKDCPYKSTLLVGNWHVTNKNGTKYG
jgi:hypothetical protein